jgi:antitoxin (DNA-binding transcriptional repressor) of toxin-antitoxin stability system
MQTVNIHDAKTHLSRLVAAIKSGSEAEIVIAQNGIPAARLVPIGKKPKIKWGLAKGKFSVPENIDALNPEISELFAGNKD